MFNNIGNKLKNIAGFYFIFGIIVIVILCIFWLFSNPLLALIYGVGGGLSIWVTACIIYGIGQAVENTDRLVEKLAPYDPVPGDPGYVPKAPVKRPNWVCFSCGTENAGNIAYCINCGTNRDWSESKQNQ